MIQMNRISNTKYISKIAFSQITTMNRLIPTVFISSSWVFFNWGKKIIQRHNAFWSQKLTIYTKGWDMRVWFFRWRKEVWEPTSTFRCENSFSQRRLEIIFYTTKSDEPNMCKIHPFRNGMGGSTDFFITSADFLKRESLFLSISNRSMTFQTLHHVSRVQRREKREKKEKTNSTDDSRSIKTRGIEMIERKGNYATWRALI